MSKDELKELMQDNSGSSLFLSKGLVQAQTVATQHSAVLGDSWLGMCSILFPYCSCEEGL